MPVAGKSSSRQNEDNAKQLDITVKRGDTLNFDYEVTYIDEAGLEQPYDFTGATVKAHIKKYKTDTKWLKVITLTITDNNLNFYIHNESLKIPAGRYYYDIEVEDTDGYHSTILQGAFIVTQDVTEWEESLEEEVTYTFKTNYSMAVMPNLQFEPAIFNTSFSAVINQWMQEVVVSTFKTSFSMLIMPTEISTPIFKTNWSVMQASYITNYAIFGTSWSAVITPYD